VAERRAAGRHVPTFDEFLSGGTIRASRRGALENNRTCYGPESSPASSAVILAHATIVRKCSVLRVRRVGQGRLPAADPPYCGSFASTSFNSRPALAKPRWSHPTRLSETLRLESALRIGKSGTRPGSVRFCRVCFRRPKLRENPLGVPLALEQFELLPRPEQFPRHQHRAEQRRPIGLLRLGKI
jgi:hypothetical protein